MSKSFFSLGLMSGTSGDGVDASIIQSDGDTKYEVILDKYFKYSQSIYQNIHNLKEEINNSEDLKNLSEKIQPLEKEITLFHAKIVNEIIEKYSLKLPPFVDYKDLKNSTLKDFYLSSKKIKNDKAKIFFSYELIYPTLREGLNLL